MHVSPRKALFANKESLKWCSITPNQVLLGRTQNSSLLRWQLADRLCDRQIEQNSGCSCALTNRTIGSSAPCGPPPERSVHGPKCWATYFWPMSDHLMSIHNSSRINKFADIILTRWHWGEGVRKERVRSVFCVKTCDDYSEGLAGGLPRFQNVFFFCFFVWFVNSVKTVFWGSWNIYIYIWA